MFPSGGACRISLPTQSRRPFQTGKDQFAGSSMTSPSSSSVSLGTGCARNATFAAATTASATPRTLLERDRGEPIANHHSFSKSSKCWRPNCLRRRVGRETVSAGSYIREIIYIGQDVWNPNGCTRSLVVRPAPRIRVPRSRLREPRSCCAASGRVCVDQGPVLR